MTIHLEPPRVANDPLVALRQHNAELERQLADCAAARQTLQDQVDMLCQAMDLLDEMVLIKDPKSRIVYANKTFRCRTTASRSASRMSPSASAPRRRCARA